MPPMFGSEGEGHTRLRERGWGVPIPTRGQTMWYSVYLVCAPATGTATEESEVQQTRHLSSTPLIAF
jgi:hypothetical protein